VPVQYVSIHGHDVAYRTAGDGPALLLVHGMAGSSSTWRSVMPALAEHATVIAPDLPGHGRSDKGRGDYSLGSLASNLRDLLVALGHERVTIVGQSLGGGVAMQFAYQYPERCERLALVSSGGLGQEVHLLLRALSFPGAEYVLALGCATPIRNAGNAIANVLGRVGLRPQPLVEEVWRAYSSLSDGETRQAFVRTLRSVVDVSGQCVSATDRLYLTSALPTLLVWGDADRIIPVSHAYAAHEAMPGSRLEVFEGVGHFPHCEAPERFVDVLRAFMRDRQAGSSDGSRTASGSNAPMSAAAVSR
jgi:pimeloyl-ACP methyl ester carboxylesterase